MNVWEQDLRNSSQAIDSIKNIIEKMLDAKIIKIENINNKIAEIFDVNAGIDYLIKTKNGLKGMATRVQYGTAWNSFTVRFHRTTGSKTELEKRINNIHNNCIYPYYTLQAYFDNVNNKKLLSLAIIDTKQLLKEIQTNKKVGTRQNPQDNNIFKYIHWNNIETKEFFKTVNSQHQIKFA